MACEDGYIGMGICGSEAGAACNRPGQRSGPIFSAAKLRAERRLNPAALNVMAQEGPLMFVRKEKWFFSSAVLE